MKWFVSGTLIALTIVAGSLLVRKEPTPTLKPVPIEVRFQPNTIADARLVGKYFFGDGLGSNNHLELEKTHRFLYRRTGCMGEYERIGGTWQQENNIVVLHPETPQKTSGPVWLNTRYIPISWGKRFYLVDENQMPGFCAAIHQKSESLYSTAIHGVDYALYTEKNLPKVQGIPTVPAAYRDFLKNGEIKATVTTVGSNGEVVLEERGTHRLKPGMRLCIDDFNPTPDLLVTSVDGSEVHAKTLPTLYWRAPAIYKGYTFTTGSYLHRPTGTEYVFPSPARQ